MRAPGSLYDIGGYQLHLLRQGQGAPSVIFDAGMGGFVWDWALVQPAVAALTTTAAYDRAGYGWSDVSPQPRAADHMARELYALLSAAHIEPPYVLVAHSYAGFVARLFASLYPNEVDGLILVDCANENVDTLFPSEIARWKGQDFTLNMALTLARLRLLPVLKMLGIDPHRTLAGAEQFPTDIRAGYIAQKSSPRRYQAILTERAYRSQTLDQVRAAQLHPDLPITIVSPHPDEDALGAALNRDFLRLSSKTRLVIAENSSHHIPRDRPDVVIQAIRDMLPVR